MKRNEIYAGKPGPELDALVHRYYADGSSPVPRYSKDWEAVCRLAYEHDLELRGMAIGGHVIMSLFRHGQYLEIGSSIDVEGAGETEVPTEVLTALAARSLVKLVLHRPELHRATLPKDH